MTRFQRIGLILLIGSLFPSMASACFPFNYSSNCGCGCLKHSCNLSLGGMGCGCGGCGGQQQQTPYLPPMNYNFAPSCAAPSCGAPSCGAPIFMPQACAPPQPVLRPVVETQYRTQNVMTYQDVPRTQLRREAYLENVPVTTYRTVVVPQVQYQAQTRYRDTPVQVMERVPRMVQQVVPEQHVRYVPEGMQMGMAPGMAPQFGGYPAPQQAFAPMFGAPMLGASTLGYGNPFAGQVPMTAELPQGINPYAGQDPNFPPQVPYNPPAANVPVPQGADPAQQRPVDGDWTTVPRRTSYLDDSTDYGIRQTRFSPAPSAAAVWQSPRFGAKR